MMATVTDPNATTIVSADEIGNSGTLIVAVANMVGSGAVIREIAIFSPTVFLGGMTVTLYFAYGTTLNAAFPSESVVPEKFDG